MVQVTVVEPKVTVNRADTKAVKVAGESKSVRVTTGLMGPPGPPGEQGPKGDTGESGTTFRHVHTQETPLEEWTITHSLGGRPSTTVVDSGGTVVEGDIDYLDENTVTITFSEPFAGQAYFS